VSDGKGGEDTALVTVNVAGVNDAPTLSLSTTTTVNQFGFTLGTNWSSYDMKDIEALDFDGDGDKDIVFSSWNGSTYDISLASNDGSGNFTITSTGISTAYQRFEVADLNGDGLKDIVLAQSGTTASPVYFQASGGTFTQTAQQLNMFYTYEIKLADMNGDGYLDIVAANTTNNDYPNKIFYNNSGGILGQFVDSGQSLQNFDTKSVAVGDLD
ncbi:MAG: VCBS repeat-containing protein, partial [Alphaproteobacteria bacterium]|nr:VCBS repeat-containing protein [Alphaproteobacteria bacterium]